MCQHNFWLQYHKAKRSKKKTSIAENADYLSIDTSTHSKVEPGERQTTYLADKINRDFGGLVHLSEGLIEAEKQIKSKI